MKIKKLVYLAGITSVVLSFFLLFLNFFFENNILYNAFVVTAFFSSLLGFALGFIDKDNTVFFSTVLLTAFWIIALSR